MKTHSLISPLNSAPIEGLTADEVKSYVRSVADRRLKQLGLEPLYNAPLNPLPWLEPMIGGVEFHQLL